MFRQFGRRALAAGILILSVGASAHAADCMSREEIQEIAARFPQFSSLAGKEYCYDDSQTSHLLRGIAFMRQTPFVSPRPPSRDELFKGDFGQSWWAYFTGRINEFEVVQNCPKRVGAYVYMFSNTMYVCPFLLTTQFSALDRASVFMHEARHIDGYPHTTCRSGARAGLQGACDTRISDRGSYAVSVETYAQLAKYGQDLHPALKAYARAAAYVYSQEAFDTPARVEIEPYLLVMTSDRKFYQVSSNKRMEVSELGEAPELGKIVMRGQMMILLPANKNNPARYVFSKNEGEIAQDGGELIQEYNGLTPEQREQVVDIHIGGQWNAVVSKSQVRFACDPRSDAKSTQSLGGETATNLIFPEGYDRAARNAFLQTASGRILEIGCQGSRQGYVRPANVAFDRTFSRIYKLGDMNFALSSDGQVYDVQGSKSVALPLSLKAPVYEIAPQATLAFFDEN